MQMLLKAVKPTHRLMTQSGQYQKGSTRQTEQIVKNDSLAAWIKLRA